jgi:uroporphyrin-III C-methyltransferase
MTGKVWLVGAGPGDASLITVKGLNCIRRADCIVYDRLVNPELLTFAGADCELINVGKNPNHHPIPQPEINRILIEQARLGRQVVRLKSGDPYVFGRGGEEAEDLAMLGLDFEVVPGITSAIGGLSYAGIPVTHRNYSSSFHVITGHLQDGKDPHNWQALAALNGTLIILMGMSQIEQICQKLIDNGRAATTPAGVVMWASRDSQRIVTSTLAHLAAEVKRQGLGAPALIVIGEVVSLSEILKFVPSQPQVEQRAINGQVEAEALCASL